MIDEKFELLSLTRIAFLNALIFSFLGLQFIMPFIFVILIWLIPVIFAIETYFSPKLSLFSSCIGVIFLSLFMGLDITLWTIFYLFVGIVSGFVWRYRLPLLFRYFFTILAFALGLAGIIQMLMLIANTSIAQVDTAFSQLNGFNLSGLPLSYVLFIGSLFVAFLISVGINSSLAKILHYLGAEVDK